MLCDTKQTPKGATICVVKSVVKIIKKQNHDSEYIYLGSVH